MRLPVLEVSTSPRTGLSGTIILLKDDKGYGVRYLIPYKDLAEAPDRFALTQLVRSVMEVLEGSWNKNHANGQKIKITEIDANIEDFLLAGRSWRVEVASGERTAEPTR